MLREFRDFAMRGNVIDLAVAFILGAAFTAIVNSFVNDVLMPPLGILVGGVDFTNLFVVLREGTPAGPYETLEAAQAAGAVTLNYGLFINSVVSFLILAAALFFLIRYAIRHAVRLSAREAEQAAAEPTMKTCPYCVSEIPVAAVRCPHCTSDLTGATASS